MPADHWRTLDQTRTPLFLSSTSSHGHIAIEEDKTKDETKDETEDETEELLSLIVCGQIWSVFDSLNQMSIRHLRSHLKPIVLKLRA